MYGAYFGGGLSRLKLAVFQKLGPIITISSSSSSSSSSRVFSSSSSTAAIDAAASPTKRVGTHDGSFHCDEALGCFLILLTNKFSGARIVLGTLDAVLDVGGVYDPIRDRYDHHQKGFKEVFGHGFTTKLSSAGLVYKAVDAIDNGINQYDTDQPPRYVNNTNLSSRVGRLNLDWVDLDQSLERENEAFQHALTLTGSEFLESVHFHAKSWLPARSIVMECLAAREDIDSSGEIMVLTRSCPWKLHIFDLEEGMKIDPTIKYVIYQVQDERSENWRVQAVAISPDKFESRKPLPSPWRGLTDEELSEAAGIPGCTFVHMSGFIGGNQTYKGALDMAKTSLMAIITVDFLVSVRLAESLALRAVKGQSYISIPPKDLWLLNEYIKRVLIIILQRSCLVAAARIVKPEGTARKLTLRLENLTASLVEFKNKLTELKCNFGCKDE
ncbi:unnamed protein product [Camellia sinensis]